MGYTVALWADRARLVSSRTYGLPVVHVGLKVLQTELSLPSAFRKEVGNGWWAPFQENVAVHGEPSLHEHTNDCSSVCRWSQACRRQVLNSNNGSCSAAIFDRIQNAL